jgi:isopentenyl diphosphate isomerase/L-lactate dehydrogenase-like FMN-dependent dehydrogenase
MIMNRIEHAERHGADGGRYGSGSFISGNGQFDEILGLPMSPKTLDDIKQFVRSTRLPFVIKGVLSEQDARKMS